MTISSKLKHQKSAIIEGFAWNGDIHVGSDHIE